MAANVIMLAKVNVSFCVTTHPIPHSRQSLPRQGLPGVWRESSAMDGKRWDDHNITIHGNWIPAIPAGMTSSVSSYLSA